MNRRVNITVSGKVQGVFFRKFTQEKALKLGIKGLVKNQPDKSVYIEAEGNDEQLRLFIDWCHKGSPLSTVKQVWVEEGELQAYPDFVVKG